MRAITNIYNSFIQTNTLSTIFVLTVFGILASFITVMFIMFIVDFTLGAESISYYNIGIFLSIIIPIALTPILSYKIINLSKKLSKANEKLSYHVQYDNLTKIYNKRHTLELANYEFALCKRVNTPISALIIECDHLKNINKSYGREVGDIVLIELTRFIKTSIRNTDIFGRYNGVRFLLICPEIDIDTAQHLAQKIKSAAKQIIHINDDGIEISVSIGCAEIHNFDNATIQTLVDEANEALLKR